MKTPETNPAEQMNVLIEALKNLSESDFYLGKRKMLLLPAELRDRILSALSRPVPQQDTTDWQRDPSTDENRRAIDTDEQQSGGASPAPAVCVEAGSSPAAVSTISQQPDEKLREALIKIRDGYKSQMKFCDIEALGYFREFVRRIDAALDSRGEG